jgi:cytochrome b subunit of formate dehydrogenase
MQSFHGLAAQIGGVSAANCASCHGVHDILPSSDPASSISPANLPTTCGKCHQGIGTRLASGTLRIHQPRGAAPGKPAIVSIISNAYVLLIVMVIGGMFVYVLLDYAAHFRAHVRGVKASPDAEVRMTPLLQIQHGLLVVLFVVLAYTGFVHTYPDAFWSWPFRAMSNGSYVRGLIHRIAGWAFTLLFLVHLIALVATSRGHGYLLELRLRWHDATDALLGFRRNVGLTKKTLPHRRFNFAEKAEYWALVWGSVVMIVTGVMLIYTNAVLRLWPEVFHQVAQVVHFYEAVLATLAIVVWHFYWVIFDPKEYPMNPAWMIGKKPGHAQGHGAEPADEDDEAAPQAPS